MSHSSSFLQPIDEKLFFTRHDPEDPRLGEFAVEAAGGEGLVTLWGYPDDEGIRLNGGRPGAAEAPERIRMSLYRMTPSRSWPRCCLINDCGDWMSHEIPLEERGDLVREAVAEHYRTSSSALITLGGGHDYGFPDGAGFLDAHLETQGKTTVTSDPAARPLILNFDAHLDVRPLDRGITSGTPFRRLIEAYPRSFDFVEIGIQSHCNSPFHWDWAIQNGATILPLEQIRQFGLKNLLEQAIDINPKRPVWLSLDIDCLLASEAPGCSAPNASGLSVHDLQEVWPWLFQSFSVKGLGIYEVSPPLDSDSRTSRIAALMIHSSLHQWIQQQAQKTVVV